MRIAIFHNLPSGGAKRSLYEWTCRLANDHEIDVYSLQTADHTFCDIRPFVSQYKVYEFASRSLFKSPFGRLNQLQRWRELDDLERLNRRIARQINLGGYDVLFANTCKFTFIPSLLQHVRIPSVYYLHEPFGPGFVRKIDRPYNAKKRWRGKLDSLDPLIWLYRHRLASIQARSVRGTTRLLANSHFTGECIQTEFGAAPGDLAIAHGPVNSSYQGYARTQFRHFQPFHLQSIALRGGAEPGPAHPAQSGHPRRHDAGD